MGNGTSHSVVLAPTGRSLGHSIHPDYRYHRSPAKYALPNNMVLPQPIAGQRLRSTDNGHILHSAGTIRGLKSASPVPQDQDEGDPEVMDILKRRSEMIEKEEKCDHLTNLRNHRMFYSDPDISQSRPISKYSPDVPETLMSRRQCGGAAARASKLKQRKKTRAPEPPPSDNYANQLQRRALSATDLSQPRLSNGLPDLKPKTRAPQPPLTKVLPPEPPPPPMPAQVKSYIPHRRPTPPNKPDGLSNGSDSYNNNNSRLSRSVGDLRINDEQRNTVFDSKADLYSTPKKPSLLQQQQQPDPFQKEIEAVTKRIAQNRGEGTSIPSGHEPPAPKVPSKLTSPKQYYFSDKDVFRADFGKGNSAAKPKGNNELSGREEIRRLEKIEKPKMELTCNGEQSQQKNTPLRKPTPNKDGLLDSSGKGSTSSPSRLSQDSEIDVRLRPVLPRKPLDIKKFSPAEAWQALGTEDIERLNRSTSNESLPHFPKQNCNIMKKYAFSDGNRSSYNCSLSDSHWTPRQDLDDSDTSSLNSEEAVIPKSQLGDFSTRFSLPSVMFSNMRPIGSDLCPTKRSIHSYHDYSFDGSPRYSQPKKKMNRYGFVSSDMNAANHFKKFLGMRNKYLSEEDVSVSDSNWTFGGNGLQQKRGKQYSSDLMLSDKKKYELVVKNNYGEFLGDVLVTKANDLRRANDRNRQRHRESDNSNFSFYSTEGQVMYLPKVDDCEDYLDSVRSRYNKADQSNAKNRFNNIDKKCSLDLIRMLEEDARRRRNKEKISIRKQLQMMKRFDSNGEDDSEDEVDEAYFTEPKSLEGSSPMHVPQTSLYCLPEHRRHQGAFVNGSSHSPLKHWTSTPALFDDVAGKPSGSRGFVSSSSVTSSPDPSIWQKQTNHPDKWLQRKQQAHYRRLAEKQRRVSEGDSSPGISKEDKPMGNEKRFNGHPPKEKKSSIYKTLMDIVRREERQMKKAEGNFEASTSRDSSYSQRESSHSSSSPDSMSSSSYSDSGSANVGRSNHRGDDYSAKSGVPANKEFHQATGLRQGQKCQEYFFQGKGPSPFQSSLVQPFSPGKGYRPVPFDVAVPAASNSCRMPTLQEGHQFQAEVS